MAWYCFLNRTGAKKRLLQNPSAAVRLFPANHTQVKDSPSFWACCCLHIICVGGRKSADRNLPGM